MSLRYVALLLWIVVHDISAEANLSSTASWARKGVTVAGWTNATSGSAISQLSQPLGIVISDNDDLYIADTNNRRVVVVPLDSSDNNSIIGSNQVSLPSDVFIRNESLYVLDVLNSSVQKTSLNAPTLIVVLSFNTPLLPYYFYVDNEGRIYLSDQMTHRVLLFETNLSNGTTVAGNGTVGLSVSQLNTPYGIYVSQIGVIYIADCMNDRIMKWLPGALFGQIVAGNGTAGASSSQLDRPTNVILDVNDYMYISESGNARITRWKPNSTFGECIAACTGMSGLDSNQLNAPHSLTFDRNGSLYVADWNNSRVQKFQILPHLNPSFNQPELCSSASWHSVGFTIANSSLLGTTPYGIFVDTNNIIYAPAHGVDRVYIWGDGDIVPRRNFPSGSLQTKSVFVTRNGDIYVDNGGVNQRVDRWGLNSTSSVPVMSVNQSCYSLFVDNNDNIYCSLSYLHQVIWKEYGDASDVITVRAGGSTAGSSAVLLDQPRGIFVDSKLDLYVADCNNNRIQLFPRDQINATTVAGTPVTSALTCPSAVVLDADGDLYITDTNPSRIVRVGSSGLQCIITCSGGPGITSSQLQLPTALSFDNAGNLFVVDTSNVRIQKFLFMSNSCGGTTTTQPALPSTISTDTGHSVNSETSTNNVQSTTALAFSLTGVHTTTSDHSVPQTSAFFVLPTSLNPSNIGFHYNTSDLACETLRPCDNYGICNNTNATAMGFTCSCPSGFSGVRCQLDHRPCRPDTCWNNGLCNETSNATWSCSCISGWYGARCQSKINYCQNINCENNGVCRSLLFNYTCECLGDAYSGRQCEQVHTQTRLYRLLSKSFAYVAIVALTIVALYVISMDALKYFFGIDPVGEELKRIQRSKKARRRRPPTRVRFIYVNRPTLQSSKMSTISTGTTAT